MIVHRGYENLRLNRPYVTIGVFDGVHLGHMSILEKLVAKAEREGGESVIVTFDPHPRLVLSQPGENISYLSTIEEKIMLIERSSAGHLVIIGFTPEFARMDADEFIRRVLVDGIGVEHLAMGHDNHLGRGKEGNYERIKANALRYGFSVERIGKFSSDTHTVSSTSIRQALLGGKLDDANRWLGYHYPLSGTVIEGRGLGKSFGYPTANIRPYDPNKLVPSDGVYAVEVIANNYRMKGMLSIGSNPTVSMGDKKRSVEVNIFDFEGDLYGKDITVIFRFRLRDEKHFGSIAELKQQMDLDREISLDLLA